MKVYIAVQMQGVAGVATLGQTLPGGADHVRSCRLMTLEANAAVAGAFVAGAERVIVDDMHGRAPSLDPELLDRRAELCSGHPKPYGMLAGLDGQYGCLLLVGFHGGAGTSPAVLDGTLSTAVFRAVRVNGVRQTDISLCAGLAGHHGVPVALVTGDETTCAEANELLGAELPTVATKVALGAEAALSLHPSVARERIDTAVREAMGRVAAGRAPVHRVSGPYELQCDITTAFLADHCAMIPGVERPAGRTLTFQTDDYRELVRCLFAMALLGAATA